LAHLHGGVPQVRSYRRFLERLEQETGMLLVELLIPPLSARADNAVRRPVYTRAFTGDPDLATYCPPGGAYRPSGGGAHCPSDGGTHCPSGGGAAARYIPLEAITVHSGPSGYWAEVDGRRIWPVYHATRSPLPPWDHVAELLLAAAPWRLPWTARRLHRSLDLFPERSWMPRITVGGDLVVSPAQWRLPADRLWQQDRPLPSVLRSLVRLRDELGLPRLLFVAAAGGGAAVPLDLESLTAVPTIDRLRAASTTRQGEANGPAPDLIAMEMLPQPADLAVVDHTDEPLVAELLLRLPSTGTPEAMAVALADRLRTRPDRPSPEPGRRPDPGVSGADTARPVRHTDVHQATHENKEMP
jgi:hypothetical protein